MMNQLEIGVAWPQDVVLGLTNRCNFSCVTCNPHRHDEVGQLDVEDSYTDMPEAVFLKLEDLFRHAKTVSMGGVGEPTISHNFIERIQWIRSLNPDIQITTFTNGTALGSTHAVEKLARAIDYLHVSVGGLASYEEIMIGGSLEQTLRNLEALRKVRRRTGRPQRVELGVVLMRSNVDDLVGLTKLAREMEFDRIAFKDLWVFDEKLKAESLRHDPELAGQIRRRLVKARDVGIPIRCEPWPELSTRIVRPGHIIKCSFGALRSGHLWPTHSTFAYWLRIMQGKLDKRRRSSRWWENSPLWKMSPVCHLPWEMAQVTETGNVLLCCEGMTELGNIREKSFWEVWTNGTASSYRTGMLNGVYYGACASCKYVSSESKSFVRESG